MVKPITAYVEVPPTVERTVNIKFDLSGLTDDGVRAFITEIDTAFKNTLKSKIICNELWGREHGIEARNWFIYSVDQ